MEAQIKDIEINRKGRPSHISDEERKKFSCSLSESTIEELKDFLNSEENKGNYKNQSHFVETAIENLIQSQGKTVSEFLREVYTPTMVNAIASHNIIGFVFSQKMRKLFEELISHVLNNIIQKTSNTKKE